MPKRTDAERSWLLVALALLLALSVGLHIARWGPEPRDDGTGIERVRELPDPRRFLIDFDAEMVRPDAIDEELEPGVVTLEPQTRVAARFVTTRRLELRFPAGAPRFQALHVRFAPTFTDGEGRPLRLEEPLRLSTGRLELVKKPIGTFDPAGVERVVELSFNGPVHARDLLRHLRLETRDGQAVEHDVRGSGRRWQVEVPVDAPAELRLVLRAGLTSSVGPRGLAGTVRADLRWPLTLEVTDIEGFRDGVLGIIDVGFTHGLAEQDLSSYVDVEPKPDDLALDVDGKHLRLRGRFPSRARITVRIRPGLRARAGSSLEAAVERRVVLPRAKPRLAFRDRGTVLSARARPVLEIEGVNVPAVEVQVRQVYANNVVPFALGWVYASSAAASPATKTMAIDAGEDEAWSRELDLADLLGKAPLGVYRVDIEVEHPCWRSDRRLLQITDLAPTVRVTAAGVVVFTRRVSDAGAVEGAVVRLFDRKNQPCGEGITDADGLLVLPGVSGEPYVVTVEKDGDLAYVEMNHHRVAHLGSDIQGRPPARGLEALLVPDRGAVRPGETAHVTGIVRDAAGRAAQAGLPIQLEVRAPDGRTWRRETRRLGPHGLFAWDLAFGVDDPTGAWRVSARLPGAETRLGSAAFRVASIVPDRIEPFVEIPVAEPRHGTRVIVRAGARLPNGSPTPSLRAKLRVRFRPHAKSPRPGYAVGDPSEAPEPFVLDVGEGTLDAAGRLEMSVALPKVGKSGLPLRATFEVEVIDVSGRAAFARETRLLQVPRPRLAVAVPAGGEASFRVALLGGDACAGEAVLERLRWTGSWVSQGGRRAWRSRETVADVWKRPFRVESGAGRIAFPVHGDGSYRMRVHADGVVPVSCRFSRWDGAISRGSAGRGAPRLIVRPRGPAVAVGTEARLQVETPFAGTLLLTVEAPSLLVAQTVDVAAGTHDLSLPLPALEGPGAYATATLMRGAAMRGDGAARLMGACWIPAERSTRRLDVALEAPERAEPGQVLRLRVRTARPATVRLLAVDEGVLRLTGHPVPDPASYFLARRALETRVADAWARLALRQRFGGEDAEAGGGQFASRLDPTARKTIETTALASALVEVDGEAIVELPLPAWEGKLRVVAIAAGDEGTGATSKDVLVEGKISLQIHLPRAAAPGDVFDATVVARGENVRWDAVLDGLERVEGTGLRLRVLDHLGTASIRVTARDGEGHVVERVARLRVRPPAPFTVEHRVHHVKAGETIDRAIDGRWAEGRKTTLTIGPIAAMVALPAIETLLAYPYGCVEQTVSKASPILAWSTLWESRAIDAGRPEDIVDAALLRLQRMQTGDGAFAMWPGGREAYPFGTVYAVDFLLRARASGRPIPARMLEDAVQWLEHVPARTDPYLLDVLARAGKPVRADVDRLATIVDDAEDQARLASAYFHLGARDKAEALLRELGDPWKTPRDTGRRLRSPVRAAATVLSALARVLPEDARVDDLALRLRHAASEAGAHTTQENAAALLALAAVERGRRAGEAGGWIEIEGRREPFKGTRRFAAGGALSFRLHADAATTLVVRVEGHRLDGLGETLERGLEIRRTIEGVKGGTLKQGEVYQVVIEGELQDAGGNVLLQDLLPGGLEIEQARNREGSFAPDRIEPRDDRVLFFRTKRLTGRFRQTYLVRAVTPGTYRVPPIEAELLYAPEIRGRASGGGTLEIVR